jgi:hypothetical protein
MTTGADIQIVRIEYGLFPDVASMNPWIDPRSPLLRASLDVFWDDPSPRRTLARLEECLARFSPSFSLHQCRGPRTYHVFASDPRTEPAPNSPAPTGEAGTNGFRPNLALAHLLEHVAIDCLCSVTGVPRCSGVTGELRGHPGRFHVMIEAPDPAVGKCCLALAVLTLTEAIANRPPGTEEQALLMSAGVAYRHPESPLTSQALACRLGWSEEQAAHALAALRDLGYLREVPSTVNMSGAPEFKIAFN